MLFIGSLEGKPLQSISSAFHLLLRIDFNCTVGGDKHVQECKLCTCSPSLEEKTQSVTFFPSLAHVTRKQTKHDKRASFEWQGAAAAAALFTRPDLARG